MNDKDYQGILALQRAFCEPVDVFHEHINEEVNKIRHRAIQIARPMPPVNTESAPVVPSAAVSPVKELSHFSVSAGDLKMAGLGVVYPLRSRCAIDDRARRLSLKKSLMRCNIMNDEDAKQ